MNAVCVFCNAQYYALQTANDLIFSMRLKINICLNYNKKRASKMENINIVFYFVVASQNSLSE